MRGTRRAAVAAMAAAAVWGTAGDAAIAEKPMTRAAVTAELSAVVDEADAAPDRQIAMAMLVAGTGRNGRPLRQDCLITHAAGPVEPPGAAARVRAALRRHGWRRLERARDRSATSVTFAKRGWTLTVSAGSWPGEQDAYDVIAVLDRC